MYERRAEYSKGKPPVAPARHGGDRSFNGTINSKRVQHERSKSQRTIESSASTITSKNSKPNSVILAHGPGLALSRDDDLSDLSGSYYHGMQQNVSSSRSIPRSIYKDDSSTLSSLQKNWTQAYVLSEIPHKTKNTNDNYWVDEAQKTFKPSTFAAIVEEIPHIPLIVLMMDIHQKVYEILRIFIDKKTDSVHDVLQVTRKSIADRWKQDYDGLLQIRSGPPRQLIHCLSVQHYDVQPFECWIAKPWSMAAKTAGKFGLSLINHMKTIGILDGTKEGSKAQHDKIVKLSETAQVTVYEPNGFPLYHYHAKHYLSFSLPFEYPTRKVSKRGVPSPIEDDESSVGQKTVRSKKSHPSPLMESSLPPKDDDKNYCDESQEVQTVSSYSHLSTIDLFPTIFEEAATTPDLSPSVPAVNPKTKKSKCSENNFATEGKQSPKRKGFKLWGRSPSNKCVNSTRKSSEKEVLAFSSTSRTSWDLTPMDSSETVVSFAASDDGSIRSTQPLLPSSSSSTASSTPASTNKSFLFRRKLLHAV